MLAWINDNKEWLLWLFGGGGAVLLGSVIPLVLKRKRVVAPRQRQRSGQGSFNVQVGGNTSGDVNVSFNPPDQSTGRGIRSATDKEIRAFNPKLEETHRIVERINRSGQSADGADNSNQEISEGSRARQESLCEACRTKLGWSGGGLCLRCSLREGRR